MRTRQLLIYERDGRLAQLLRGASEAHDWHIHEPRRLETCLQLLRKGPGILVLKIGRDLAGEFHVLERITWLFPEIPVIVIIPPAADAIADLAWDLGAKLVLESPPVSRDLCEMVGRFLAQPIVRKDP